MGCRAQTCGLVGSVSSFRGLRVISHLTTPSFQLVVVFFLLSRMRLTGMSGRQGKARWQSRRVSMGEGRIAWKTSLHTRSHGTLPTARPHRLSLPGLTHLPACYPLLSATPYRIPSQHTQSTPCPPVVWNLCSPGLTPSSILAGSSLSSDLALLASCCSRLCWL